jgi:hypothetical protein
MISAIQVFNVTPEAIQVVVQVFVAQSFKEKEEVSFTFLDPTARLHVTGTNRRSLPAYRPVPYS